MPEKLPIEAQTVLRGLDWHRKARPDPVLFSTLVDPSRPGQIGESLQQDVRNITARLRACT